MGHQKQRVVIIPLLPRNHHLINHRTSTLRNLQAGLPTRRCPRRIMTPLCTRPRQRPINLGMGLTLPLAQISFPQTLVYLHRHIQFGGNRLGSRLRTRQIRTNNPANMLARQILRRNIRLLAANRRQFRIQLALHTASGVVFSLPVTKQKKLAGHGYSSSRSGSFSAKGISSIEDTSRTLTSSAHAAGRSGISMPSICR